MNANQFPNIQLSHLNQNGELLGKEGASLRLHIINQTENLLLRFFKGDFLKQILSVSRTLELTSAFMNCDIPFFGLICSVYCGSVLDRKMFNCGGSLANGNVLVSRLCLMMCFDITDGNLNTPAASAHLELEVYKDSDVSRVGNTAFVVNHQTGTVMMHLEDQKMREQIAHIVSK